MKNIKQENKEDSCKGHGESRHMSNYCKCQEHRTEQRK